ncbi:helix-turn-helix domain-containing protein, partial [Escherichia coli]|nr:helix-turn-helix domain-containing protein [Escherichia coli]
ALIAAQEEAIPLATLAAAVGYAPHHFQRVFTRATGMSPAAYARARRAARAADTLHASARVTDALYAAGYGAPSRFYAEAGARLGMTPSAWARGGAGVTIRWTRVDTSLGPLLIAATEVGLCRIAFDEDEATLAARFPLATIAPADARLADLAAAV